MGHLYILRHGETTCNADAVIQGPRVDSSLSELGFRQAAALGSAFQSTPVGTLYTSPLTRARQTTQGLLDGGLLGGAVAPEVVPELYEMDFGAFCGQSMDAVRDEMEQVEDAWGLGFVDAAYPGGESPVLARLRVQKFARRLRDEVGADDGGVAVVAHGRINRVLVTTLLGLPLTAMDRFPQDNANITHLESTADGFVVRRVNDTRHLESAST